MGELGPEDKIWIFRELVRGADDVFASRRDGTWGPVYSPLTDEIVRLHLMGLIEIGSYPLIPSTENGGCPTVAWICADFDGKKDHVDWQGDVQKAVEFLLDSECCLFVNLSRSAQGAHVRVLFREPVPAWMARRWMTAWLEEAGVMGDPDEWDEPIPPSFDRLIPPQDWLTGRLNRRGNRMPGNLAGNPLHGGLARKHGGTLPLDPYRVLKGDFQPDGDHWGHVVRALEAREWSEAELAAALAEAPGSPPVAAPAPQTYAREGDVAACRSLPVFGGASDRSLDYTLKFCSFMQHMHEPSAQTYQLWVALASELHRFGEAGREAFHAISALDARYSASDTEQKWAQTKGMHPVRCDTLVSWGYRCPHLGSARCKQGSSPAFFADHTDAEIL